MARSNAGVALYEFERCLEVASGIYGSVREECIYSWESINEGMGAATAQKIVGLAFVGAIAGWEDYLENSFLRYMAGASSSGGYRPTLRLGPCSSISHARQVLGGSSSQSTAARRMFWADYRWVEETAKIYFAQGHPFAFDNPLTRLRLDTAFSIRNRIVHNSVQAKRRFKETANRLIGDPRDSPLPRGFSPGKLLIYNGATDCFDQSWLSLKTTYRGDLFEAFIVMFYDLSGQITPL